MYFPVRHEARAALENNQGGGALERRQLGNDDDPVASFFSVIFGGGDDTPTTSTRRTTTTVVRTTVVQPTVQVTTPTPHTPTTTSTTSTTTTRPLTTAQVITTPPPIVTTPDLVTVTSTASNSANTGINDASQSNSSSKSGLPSVVVGVIVAACVIFGLIFLALIARKIFQARRRRNRTTWARTSVIAPFEAPVLREEKALPPPPPAKEPSYPTSYPAYPPAALSYAQPQPYSPAAPSSAGYPAPYPFAGAGNINNNAGNMTTAGLFNSNAYAPADLAGAAPVVIQQTPPTPLTAAPTTGPISVVKRTFVPSLPDELSIATGDQVRVISAYDDGWAMCEKVGTGERGVVPQECLEEVKSTSSNTPSSQSSESVARLNRASSLKRVDQGQTY